MSRSLRLVVVVAWLLAPAVASAASEEGSGASTLLWHALNLIVLLSVIVYFGRKPIREFFGQRQSQVRNDLDSAAALLADAEGRLAEWQQRAEGLDDELDRIREGARRRGEAERARILADAQASAERIQADAQAAIAQETQRAREELRAEAARLATDLAGDLLRREVNDEDRQRLVDEFVTRIETGRPN